MQSWKQVIVTITDHDPVTLDLVTDILFEWGAGGSEVRNAYDYLVNHENLFGEIGPEITEEQRSQPIMIIGYFDNLERQPDDMLAELQSRISDQVVSVDLDSVTNENWHKKWMENYQPEPISRFVTIVPEWLDYEARSHEHLVRLDPGMAFGTGNHATTQLGAQALEIVMRGGERVLDVGTGSGILSFIAALLGAETVLGVDLDPQAVHSAIQNQAYQTDPAVTRLIKDNKLSFHVNDLMEGIEGPYEIIVANILPHILERMLGDAYQQLTDTGTLILGGILLEKGAFIEQAVMEHGFELVQKTQLKNWLGYILRKKA